MEFLTLQKMKKQYPFYNNGTNTIIYDFSFLLNYVEPDMIEQITSHIYKNNGYSCIESASYGNIANDNENGYKLYIDIDFGCTNVYSTKSGKRLYTFKKAVGCIIKKYEYNIYRVVPNYAEPIEIVMGGTMLNGELYKHYEVKEEEI